MNREKISLESIEDILNKYYAENINYKEIIANLNLELKYNDPILKGELTTPYIDMLSQYQESVYLAYLAINGKKEDLRFLTTDEYNALNLKFKIEEGSDIIKTAVENASSLENLISGMADKMTGEQIVISILIIFGYLTIDKLGDKLLKYKENIDNKKIDIEAKKLEHDKDMANIQREEKLYNAFTLVTEKLDNNIFEKKRKEAMYKPLIAYPNNELKTVELEVTSEEAKKEMEFTEIETIIKEGIFIVDGIKGASGDSKIFWLKGSESKDISIQLTRSDTDIMKAELLYSNMGKKVKAKIIIEKKDNKIIKKKLDTVENIKED